MLPQARLPQAIFSKKNEGVGGIPPSGRMGNFAGGKFFFSGQK